MKKIILITCLFALSIVALSGVPVVSNVIVNPGSGVVNISYDLSADAACDVRIIVSNDGGTTYDIYPTTLTGAVGNNVTPGSGKQILWYPAGDGVSTGSFYKVRVVARDNPTQDVNQFQSFVKVVGGTFHNGSSNITVSSFFIDKHEVTQNEYYSVMGVNPSGFSGNPHYPVERVSWLKAIEYCNRRSLQEGLTPCYSYDIHGSNPANWPSGWSSSNANHDNVYCNWTNSGYRLPSEMEWMFAARGGILSNGYTYSGSNTLGSVAWYSLNSGGRTSYVGQKTANELGTYDQSGNVWEWVWDRFGDYLIEDASNPTGPINGSDRICRGGSWNTGTDTCAVSYRSASTPTGVFNYIGLRVVRNEP